MADEINPTLPIKSPLPITVPEDEKRRQTPKKKQAETDPKQSKNEDKIQQQQNGLFDEYV
ncbi:MAG: hypothetical protein ACKE9I_05940 [Methylophagaceae bacterium]